MKKYLPFFILAAPLVASAQQRFGGLLGLIRDVGSLIKLLIPLVAAIALLAFFWGLAKFLFKAGDIKGREEGRNIMIWGVIALFVMVSVWGIVGFLQAQLGLPNTTQGIPAAIDATNNPYWAE